MTWLLIFPFVSLALIAFAVGGVAHTWTPANSEVLRKQNGVWVRFDD